jgi:excisionase family DNA binding protein
MPMISLAEAARQLGLTRQRIQQLVIDRDLPTQRAGNQVLIDTNLLVDLARRPAARPLSSRNAWALLAILSRERPEFIDRHQLSKLRHLAADRDRTISLVRHSQPRSRLFRFEFFPAQLRDLATTLPLKTGLAARLPALHLVTPDELLDAYLPGPTLEDLRRRYRPEEGVSNPNAVLRVPTQDWVLSGVRPLVVAADLLNHPDPRVVREAEGMF